MQIRVRCLECREEHFIEMKLIGTEKQQRSLGYEYEHIARGELKCSHCDNEMKLLISIYEYPKGFINYIDVSNESCLEMDDITKEMCLNFIGKQFKPIYLI
jgi:hypothetical protein